MNSAKPRPRFPKSETRSVMDLLVVGSDRISQDFLRRLENSTHIIVVIDRTSRARRVVRLLRRGSLTPTQVLYMLGAELRRPRYPTMTAINRKVLNNTDLAGIIQEVRPRRVYLFRAGLIVNSSVLNLGIEILNFHSASIRTHGGLGSIHRALRDGLFDQVATLHRVTTAIDSGEIIDVEPYRLDPERSYFWNEQTAYGAGITLALRHLKR